MVRWTSDPTERFPKRPYYEIDELEHECDALIAAFFRARHTPVTYPISTNDLTLLVESEANSLDLYAELDEDVDGQTDFSLNSKPVVQIAKALSEQAYRENRLRTTLTHELAHIRFHAPLFVAKAMQPRLFDDDFNVATRCHRNTIIGASTADWLEWQAGYSSAAMLMPRHQVSVLVQEVIVEMDLPNPIAIGSVAGIHLMTKIRRAFLVSQEAAQVRLCQLGHLTAQPLSPPLL